MSADTEDGSIVQWGTLLAPPQTEATTTLRLVANVQDFTVPQIDVSVQAGLHTDMSFEGALTSALDTDPGSPLGMQRQTIALVVDVNDVLTRAGGTVTEIRENLNDTSDTLGVRAAQRLDASSEQLTAEMHALGTQVTSLGTSLSSTVNSTSSSMNAELSQIVSTMSGMLGDTDRKAPELYENDDCSAKLKEYTPDGTVFSMFLYLSALLDGYADVSNNCQELIAEKLNDTIGPELPDAESCAEESQISATCSLFEGQTSVQRSMQELEARGAEVAGNIKTTTADDAFALSEELRTNLGNINALISELEQDNGRVEDRDLILAEIEKAEAQSALLSAQRGPLLSVSTRLGQIDQRQTEIARDICDLDRGANVVDPAELDALSAELTGLNCDGTTPDPTMLPRDAPINDLQDQAQIITNAANALNKNGPQSDLAKLDASITQLKELVNTRLGSEGWNSISTETASRLRSALGSANGSADLLQSKISLAQNEQAALGEQIAAEFERAATNAGNEVGASIGEDIESVSAQRDESLEEIRSSYVELITNLRASSVDTEATGATLINEQQASLEERLQRTERSLSDRTLAAITSIERSTAASTRDVNAASAQLTDSLNKVILDLGDPEVEGSGILGAMSASAAQSDTADYQLAEASQHAAGYANVRDQDISAILLSNAQFRAALERTNSFPPFHLSTPDGATGETVYAFHLAGGDQ